jgi:ferredoxin-NADP reductase
MPIYKLKLIEKREVARGTIVFSFEKPAGFTFKAGQYGGFTLIDPPETDAGGITRRFSLLSAPTDTHLAFVTRIQASAYKRVLKDLPAGSEIKFAGPTGNFILNEDISTPSVLLAGGVGIAPFYSMIKQSLHEQPERQVILFYGNQQRGDTAFLQELTEWSGKHPAFKFIPTMAADEQWQGEKGFITYEMLRRYIPDIFTPYYYICGSPAMVTALQEMLAETGMDEERIKVEDFPGY